MLEDYAEFGEHPLNILKSMNQPSKWFIHGLYPQLSTYVKGPIALLGDAVCTSVEVRHGQYNDTASLGTRDASPSWSRSGTRYRGWIPTLAPSWTSRDEQGEYRGVFLPFVDRMQSTAR